MKAFKMRLEGALGSGTALALLCLPACGGNADKRADGASGASQQSGGAGAEAGRPASAGGSASTGGTGGVSEPLTPYPVNALGCSGPSLEGGFYGQCCAEALCYTPETGSDCAAPSDAPEKLGKSYGSGRCLCTPVGTEGIEAIGGPFAANPAHTPEQPGSCCYVISSIACEGRPLLVDGAPIVCSLMERRDWLLAELLERWV